MKENIKITPFYCNDPDLEEIGELYCIAFLNKNFSLEDKEKAIININKHADYEGFKGLKAINTLGNIVGFSYGYTSIPKQFYREKIANQLSEIEIHTWLNNSFEFVELAVSPSYKRLGIASRLHDTLLEMIDHRTAVLTTNVNNLPAINLYRKKGWELIKTNAPVLSNHSLQMIMGKEIY
ncbi:N-acetyltransferase [Oceanobacillus piezotolerans]|uniref:N-acetyltransferase n=1 Tax=Oceanobacillus piezotolerans TaxID=2448030 RepID=A0A498DAC5_9BACI|nr:GNAT family N-acetyltransferase [Oceanobacillus piezotolerans]RLL48283.1 N-acetyltransferase [Oceanobacillus piezotolerans]